MNKALLSPVLYALLVSSAHADTLQQPNAVPDTSSNVSSTPAAPVPPPTTTTTTTTTATPAAAPAPTAALDCNYHIPANQPTIDTALVTTWAEKAALQSFNFTPTGMQTQLDALKLCYTEQGWKGFNDALQKSGNIDSIKNQQLNVSSQANGAAAISAVKDGQWKVTLPIQVVYQNDKEKVTQQLVVGVLVGRKPSGDLGIMQLVATTRTGETSTESQAPTTAPAPTVTTTPTTPEGKPAMPVNPPQP